MYFKKKLEELSTVIAGVSDDVCESQSEMDIDDNYSKKNISKDHKLVKDIGKVVRNLRSLGFMSMSEDAYASAIFVLLKVSMFS